MNNLQKLIRLRGLTITDIANRIGYGYHSTQKVIKGATYPLADGSKVLRTNRKIEEAVARLLGLSRDEAWGSAAHTVLPRLIRSEIEKKADQRKQDLRRQWLPSNNVPKSRASGNV
ncbi:MAG: hypothetical protein KJ630_01355 [Proteobacteria bacterium]|nr:hypothetical protein [Pseudomonadota bacterium]